MKMFSLFVCPTTSPKVSPFIAFRVALSNVFGGLLVTRPGTGSDILHQLLLLLKRIASPGFVSDAIALNGHGIGQQHIYATVALQAINRRHTGSELIRFSNGRTPYITKQEIL